MKPLTLAKTPRPTRPGGDSTPHPTIWFRLYVAGGSPNTSRAIENLRLACQAAGNPQYDLEIIDVMREPRRALDDHIIVAPTLVKIAPGPERRMIGDLRDRAAVVAMLGLAERLT